MSATGTHARPAERLLAQADLLLALGRAFSLPTPARVADLEAVAEVALELTTAAGAPEPGELADTLRAASRAAREAGADAWAAEHQRLFACAVVCPIHEAGFVRRDKGNILGDIAGFHRAFGVAVPAEAYERVDHLVAELEFMGALHVMLARAEAEGREGPAEVTRAALRAFAEDHPGEWLPGFARQLAAATRLPVYAHLAEALEHAWTGIAADIGVGEGPGRRLLLAEPEPGSPYECGMAEPEADL